MKNLEIFEEIANILESDARFSQDSVDIILGFLEKHLDEIQDEINNKVEFVEDVFNSRISVVGNNIESLEESISDVQKKNIYLDRLVKKVGDDVKRVEELSETISKEAKDARSKELKKAVKEILSNIPESKGDLKIIRENIEIDPLSVIQKIMELPPGKFKIKSDQVEGLEQTMSAFRSQLGRGYLHGGGDTVGAGANINITTDNNGRKVISSLTGAVSRTMTYNADGTLNVTTDSYGTRTCVYSSGLLTGINGTGIYPTKTIGYNGSGVVTSITIS